jgi:predicted TIM-barrel fold metal-dependent hydrolase
MIIDCHCHAGTGDGLTGPWDTRASLRGYLEHADRVGITHSVLFSCFDSDYAHANRRVRSIVLSNPNRFYGFVFVHAERDKGRIDSLVQEMVLTAPFVGIKLHRVDARISREVCEVARKWSLPVLYDVFSDVSVVDLLATEYPQVNFIIPHLGSFNDDWKAQRQLIDPLVRYPNIYTDTSGIRRFDVLNEAVRRAGTGKFLFGSDGPWLSPQVELSKIDALQLCPRGYRQVTSENWLRITRIARDRHRNQPDLSIPDSSALPIPGRRPVSVGVLGPSTAAAWIP